MATLLVSGRAVAQSFQDLHPGTWEASAEVGYAVEKDKLTTPDGGADTQYELRRRREQLSMRNQGFFFINPGFITGNLGLTLGVNQDRESSGDSVNSRSGKLLGYSFDTTIFGALPYNGQLFANRGQTIASRPLGRSELTSQNMGAVAQLREDSELRDLGFPYLSGSVRLEQQGSKESTTSVLGQTFQRDERQNILSLDSHKGFETADLELHYTFNSLDDREFPAANFHSQTLNLIYSQDFGPMLNRRSDSRLFYYTRGGTTPLSILNAAQNLAINHADNLSTGYRYQLTRAETDAGTTTAQNAGLNARYQPFRNLSSDANMAASTQSVPSGKRDTYSTQLGLQYQHALPWDGTLTAHGSGRYQVDDNRLSATQISVTDETHGAPSSLGAGAGFLLSQPFVVAASIIVVDTRGGARLRTVLGMDYVIVTEGNLTRIVPLATSAVIQADDVLAVSYTYQVDATIKFGTTSRSASMGLNYRWLTFSYGHDQSNQTLMSGLDSGFLENVRKDTTQLDLRGSWRALQAQASGGRVRYDGTHLAYTQRRYKTLVSYQLARGLRFGLNSDLTRTDFSLPLHRTDALSTQFTLDWFAGVFSSSALIGRRVYKDSLQPTETINEARLKFRLTYGKLDLASSFTAGKRTLAGFQASNWAAEFNVIRRF